MSNKWSNFGLYAKSAGVSANRPSLESDKGDSKPMSKRESLTLAATARVLLARQKAAQAAWLPGFEPHHISDIEHGRQPTNQAKSGTHFGGEGNNGS